jgi:hypothetical protein
VGFVVLEGRGDPRVATAETEATLVEWALRATAAQLDLLVPAQRRVVRSRDVRSRHDGRHLSWRWDDDGSLIGSFRLPPEQATILLQALDAAKDSLSTATPPIADTPADASPVDSAADASAEASSPPAPIWPATEPGLAVRPGTHRCLRERVRRRRGSARAGHGIKVVDALVQIAADFLDRARKLPRRASGSAANWCCTPPRTHCISVGVRDGSEAASPEPSATATTAAAKHPAALRRPRSPTTSDTGLVGDAPAWST